jgi:hypothetical protein
MVPLLLILVVAVSYQLSSDHLSFQIHVMLEEEFISHRHRQLIEELGALVRDGFNELEVLPH